MKNWLVDNWKWFKSFFSGGSAASMMRLLNFICIISGNGIIWFCVITETEGYATYGIELAFAGLFGKGYQDYTNYRRDKDIKKSDGENSIKI